MEIKENSLKVATIQIGKSLIIVGAILVHWDCIIRASEGTDFNARNYA